MKQPLSERVSHTSLTNKGFDALTCKQLRDICNNRYLLRPQTHTYEAYDRRCEVNDRLPY